jgi:hypothetical protein
MPDSVGIGGAKTPGDARGRMDICRENTRSGPRRFDLSQAMPGWPAAGERRADFGRFCVLIVRVLR